jgi:hypothetical protein
LELITNDKILYAVAYLAYICPFHLSEQLIVQNATGFFAKDKEGTVFMVSQ